MPPKVPGVQTFKFHNTITRVADRFTPEVATAWLRAVSMFEAGIDEKALNVALASKNMAAIDKAVGGSRFGQMMQALEPPLARTVGVAGTVSQEVLGAGGIEFSFNAVHPDVIAFARDQSAALVVDVAADVKEATRVVIATGAQQGLTIPQQARAIREIAGLPPTWAKAPLNFADELKRGAIAKATDRRISAVDKAQIRSRAAKGTMTDSFIASMQERYSASLMNRRGLNIAATESIRSANFGVQNSWDQALKQGALGKGSRKFWLPTPDERLCVPARTPVMTLDGWREIASISPGTFVLTKEDRFRPVLRVFSYQYEGETVTLQFKARARLKVVATTGHMIMTNTGWLPIEEVDFNTQVRVLAVPCPGCGELIPRGPGRKQWCVTCGRARSVKAAAAPEVRKRALTKGLRTRAEKARKKEHGAAIRKGKAAAKRKKAIVHARMHAAGKKGGAVRGKQIKESKMPIGFKDPVILRKALLNRKMTTIERRVMQFLEKQGIVFEREWPFKYDNGKKEQNAFADFYLPGPCIVIECDGLHHSLVPERDIARDAALNAQGITALRFGQEQIEQRFAEVASAIREHCCFVWLSPTRITRALVAHQPMHDLEVLDDKSYVAGGVVVHNSPEHATIPSLNPKGRKLDEEFVTTEGRHMYPPSRTNCRCGVALRAVPGKGIIPKAKSSTLPILPPTGGVGGAGEAAGATGVGGGTGGLEATAGRSVIERAAARAAETARKRTNALRRAREASVAKRAKEQALRVKDAADRLAKATKLAEKKADDLARTTKAAKVAEERAAKKALKDAQRAAKKRADDEAKALIERDRVAKEARELAARKRAEDEAIAKAQREAAAIDVEKRITERHLTGRGD